MEILAQVTTTRCFGTAFVLLAAMTPPIQNASAQQEIADIRNLLSLSVTHHQVMTVSGDQDP